MGFSLEAIVTVPACLALLLSTLGQAAPVSVNLMDTAFLANHSSLESQDSDACCRHYVFERAGNRHHYPGIPDSNGWPGDRKSVV